MPDFSRPEYASYVQLCRELRLPFWHQDGPQSIVSQGDGDWFYTESDLHAWAGHVQQHNVHAGGEEFFMAQEGDIWLPTLSDWLERIDLLPTMRLIIRPVGHQRWEVGMEISLDEGGYGLPEFAYGPTPEEAAARLWMAVKE